MTRIKIFRAPFELLLFSPSFNSHNNSPPARTCPGQKEYNSCGAACQRECSNWFGNTKCTLPCVEGCFCPEQKASSMFYSFHQLHHLFVPHISSCHNYISSFRLNMMTNFAVPSILLKYWVAHKSVSHRITLVLQVLNHKGECVDTVSCGCLYNGEAYAAGQVRKSDCQEW